MSIRSYIAFGSNLGDRLSYIQKAKELIQSHPQIQFIRESRIYDTEPLTLEESDQQDRYLNGVFEVDTTLTLHELVNTLKQFERHLGRHPAKKWTSRIIDLDILFYGNVVFEDEIVKIPHRQIIHRKFVLQPLHDLCPQMQHPEFEMTIEEILENTADPLDIKPYDC